MPSRAALAVLIALLNAGSARANTSLPLDPSQFTNPSQLIEGPIANGIITTVGQLADDRPYEPATPLGSSLGLDLGVELTLVKIPDAFNNALASVGMSQSFTVIPSIPLPKINIHKGWTNRADLGFSGVQYLNYKIYGGDLKLVVYNPDESEGGLTWALRFCYSYASIGFVTTNTYTPQILVSRKLEFADPYMGLGYQLVRGKIDFNVQVNSSVPSIPIDASGGGGAALGFVGVSMRMPGLGIRVTLEGAYNTGGASTMGTKVGIGF